MTDIVHGPPGRTASISIVVPCYNAATTLIDTLDSVLAQEEASFEVIVIDDGSTDGSLAVARCYEPRVRVVSGPNRGPSAARNRGIRETTADWLLFLDADDVLLPGTLGQRIAAANDADVVICDWEDMIDDGQGGLIPGVRHSIDWSAIGHAADLATATHAWATTAAILYRRSLVERIGGFRTDLPVIQDARFLFDAAYHGGRFAHSDHLGARYRVVAGSLSRRSPARFWQDVLLNGQQIEALWKEKGALDTARLKALAEIYNAAARGLFDAAHPGYFEAILTQRKLGLPLPRHGRVAAPMARVVGLRAARSIASLVAALIHRSTIDRQGVPRT